jgi:hypothetical protein
MDTESLKHAAQNVLQQYREFFSGDPETTINLVIDTPGDHYLLVEQGWQKGRRIYGTVIHLDIVDDKIWIQHDGTESGVAYELIDLGVPIEQIVLGFKSPERRKIAQLA